MKNLKNTKGITLIALVITIIVLLILAGVTIATLTGDNGLLSKANTAKNTSTDAEIEEEIRLAWNKVYMDSYLDSTTDKANALKTELEKNGYTVEDVSVNGTKITITNYRGKDKIINVSTGTVEDKKPGIGDLVTKDNYGDYIDLGQNVVKTSATTDDWKILYNDKVGHVYAILADYLPNSNSAVSESGLNKANQKYNVNMPWTSTNNRDVLLAKLDDATVWQSLIPEKLRSSCQVNGATTGDIIMASYNEKYNVNPAMTYTDMPYLYIDNDSSKGVDVLYTPHPGTGYYEGCGGYWLSSPWPGFDEVMCYMDHQGYINNNDYYSQNFGLCPVVSIPSNLQVTKNGTIWTVVQ